MSNDLTPASESAFPQGDPSGTLPAVAPGAALNQPRFDQDDDEGGGLDIRRMLAALYRYKWIVVASTIAGTGLGTFGARLIKPEYQTEAKVWFTSPTAANGPIAQGVMLETTGFTELLRSFLVLDYAVEKLRLYLAISSAERPMFATFELSDSFVPGQFHMLVEADSTIVLSTQEGILVERVAPGDSVGAGLGWRWVPNRESIRPGAEFNFGVTRPRDQARMLARAIRTSVDREGSFLTLTLSGFDPDMIAAKLNAVIERYVDVAADLKREKLSEFAKILGEQLDRAATGLRDAEIELESFRINTITLPTDATTSVGGAGIEQTMSPVLAEFFNLRVARDVIAQDIIAIERALATAIDSGVSVNAYEVIGSVQTSSEMMQLLGELLQKQAELRSLQYRYTDAHPEVARVQGEVAEISERRLPTQVRLLLSEMSVRAAELDRRIASASQELEQIPVRATQEARLRRNVAVAQNLQTMLQQRYEEARLAEASTIPEVRILDRAVAPVRPMSNPTLQFMAIGVLGGLGLGLLSAVLLDRIDGRVRYPDQITTELGLPLLGVVPRLKGAGNGSAPQDVTAVIEAIRGIRLNLVHAYGAAGPLIVTVTSPGGGEGKSFVSANLAQAFAHAGHRTVLVDGDSRRGSLHRVIHCQRKPGLTDCLAGRLPVGQAVQETEYASLHFLGCGTRMPNAPEFLGSQATQQLIMNLRSTYSVVIIDSPPLSAGVDAFALGTATGNVLMVLRLGMSDRELAEAKLDIMDRLPVRVLGAVLNDMRAGPGYYGGYYGGYSYYLPGYEAEDEENQGDRTVLASGSKTG